MNSAQRRAVERQVSESLDALRAAREVAEVRAARAAAPVELVPR